MSLIGVWQTSPESSLMIILPFTPKKLKDDLKGAAPDVFIRSVRVYSVCLNNHSIKH